MDSSNNPALLAALDATLAAFDCKVGTIHRLDPADNMLKLAAQRGMPPQILDRVSLIPIGKGMAGLAAERREPVHVCNLQTDESGQAKPGAKMTQMEGSIAFPMFDGDALCGVMGVAKPVAYEFTKDEIARLLEIGRALASHMKTPAAVDVASAIKQRRSVKHFDPNHKMTDDEEKRLLELAMLSPTAFNIQHWRFVVVRDPELRKKIRAISWNQSQVTDASMFIGVCADLRAWEKQPARYWANTSEAMQKFIVGAIDTYYRNKPQVERDEAFRSCGIAAQTIMLAAKGMGYDSCPMDGFDFDAATKLLNLPDDHVITMFIAVGKATKPANPRGGQLPMSEVVIENAF